jgi:hypothetical protein
MIIMVMSLAIMMGRATLRSNTVLEYNDDDGDVYLDKLQTRGVKKSILYM